MTVIIQLGQSQRNELDFQRKNGQGGTVNRSSQAK